MTIGGTAVFGTFALASFFSLAGCCFVTNCKRRQKLRNKPTNPLQLVLFLHLPCWCKPNPPLLSAVGNLQKTVRLIIRNKDWIQSWKTTGLFLSDHKLAGNHLEMTPEACDCCPTTGPCCYWQLLIDVSYTDYILSQYWNKIAHQSCIALRYQTSHALISNAAKWLTSWNPQLQARGFEWKNKSWKLILPSLWSVMKQRSHFQHLLPRCIISCQT